MTNPLLLTDFYKVGHKFQYPEGTEFVYSNFTARASRIPGIDQTVFFGLQHFLRAFSQEWESFFRRPKSVVLGEYRQVLDASIGPLPSYPKPSPATPS